MYLSQNAKVPEAVLQIPQRSSRPVLKYKCYIHVEHSGPHFKRNLMTNCDCISF